MRYAIVGFGCAGYHCAEQIRKLDPKGDITVFSGHGDSPYNPMLTTYYAGRLLPREGLFPFGTLSEISRRLCLDIRPDCRVARVCGKSRELCLENDGRETFDRILIATGASPLAPSIPGLDAGEAYFMRTMADAERLRQALNSRPIRRAVVVGASMVGIKVAELLNNRGIATVLADLAPGIFPLAAYADVAGEIQRRVEQAGVRLALGCTIGSVSRDGDDLVCSMTDGSTVRAQLAALCIGTRADTGLVDPAEIPVNRGIIVNQRMETGCPGIYAAGDCCEGTDLLDGNTKIIGLWANAGYQGGTAGHNMAGGSGRFDGNILHNITHFMGMDFVSLGDCRRKGRVLTCGNPAQGLYIRAVLADGRLAGVNILDNYRISGAVKNYFYRQLAESAAVRPAISHIQRGILVKEGISPSFLRQLEGGLR
ncbi:MAG: NAD(P)/FAD-dependent oxidoreductase [Clostridium sp.]|nr:NAD(P)/FAD-dependent oxidoreductase [Clostridium sp.]